MKNKISNINAVILDKDSLKMIKGGVASDSGSCGNCMDLDGKEWACSGTEGNCCCNGGGSNFVCG